MTGDARGEDAVEWRHPTKDDVPAWAELVRACEAVDRTGEHLDEDDLAEEFDAPLRDPANAWFGFDGGELVAFGWAWGMAGAANPHRVQLWGAVHPARRRRGIGSALLVRLEERGRAVHHALHPGERGVLELTADEHEEGRLVLATRSGYEPLRYWFEMGRSLDGELPPAGPVAGLELVPYAAELDDEVRAAHNEAFADHWGSAARTEAEWRSYSVGRHFRPDMSFVVRDGAEVAGYLISHHYPADAEATGQRDGWIVAVGTRRPWRGRGVARALIGAALAAYRRGGFDQALLGVDAANPTGALGLYERLGFRSVRTAISYAKPV